MLDSKTYWDNKIISWEKSYFDNKSYESIHILEKIASKFRKPLIARKQNLLQIIQNEIKDKTICEFGCGTGDLISNISNLGATKVYGLDISQKAVSLAKNIYTDKKIKFSVQDLSSNAKLPEADLYFGLGFIDYLNINEITSLISKIDEKGSKYVFSVPEKKLNIINILHLLYLKIAGCPKFYKFSKTQFSSLPNHNFTKINNQLFIKNFN